jgi:hypothetical protein
MRSKAMTTAFRLLACASAAVLLFEVAIERPFAQTPTPASTSEPKYSETIEYFWPDKRVAVGFNRLSPDSGWIVRVRDSWFVLEQSKEPGKTWGESASRCSREECLQFIDIGLTRFQAAKPGNKINEFVMDMQMDSELWSEVLAGMRKSLSGLKGLNPGGSFFPDSIIDKVLEQERSSQTIKDVTSLLAKHGLIARDFGFAAPPSLRPSLAGKTWSEIARLPDVGIDVPPEVYAAISEQR